MLLLFHRYCREQEQREYTGCKYLHGTCFTTDSHIPLPKSWWHYCISMKELMGKWDLSWVSGQQKMVISEPIYIGIVVSFYYIYYLYILYCGLISGRIPKSIISIRFLSSGWYSEVSTALCIFCCTEKSDFYLKLSHIYYIPHFLHCVNSLLVRFNLWQKAFTFSIHSISPQWKFADGWVHTKNLLYSLPSQYFFPQRILCCPVRMKLILSGWNTIYIHFKGFLPK